MKTIYLILVLILTLTIGISSAEANSLCYLYVAEPTIIHNVYGPNTSSNPVNVGVLNILKAKGFNITNNSHYANYIMKTEVRCGLYNSASGYFDACQTAIYFDNALTGARRYTSGPTPAKMGLKIDFNNVKFPNCSELTK